MPVQFTFIPRRKKWVSGQKMFLIYCIITWKSILQNSLDHIFNKRFISKSEEGIVTQKKYYLRSTNSHKSNVIASRILDIQYCIFVFIEMAELSMCFQWALKWAQNVGSSSRNHKTKSPANKWNREKLGRRIF